VTKTIFADLPRFDTPPMPGQLAAFLQAAAGGAPTVYPNGDPIEAEPGDDPASSKSQAAADAAEPDAVPAVAEDDLKAVIAEFKSAIEAVEASVEAQVTRATHALAMRLFPKLSDAFLADEVARQLPDLVPLPVCRIHVQAEDRLTYKLNELLAETDLAQRCEIVVDPAPSDSRIRVSWESGGVVFDFDGLLQACLARLQADQDSTGALGHVES